MHTQTDRQTDLKRSYKKEIEDASVQYKKE
jgi:hypothetical protein